MTKFQPYMPQGDSPESDWKRAAHRAAFTERRILRTPGARTSETSFGVIHKPKVIEEDQQEEVDHFFFAVRWLFPSGIPVGSNTDPVTNEPSILTPVLYNCSIAEGDDYSAAIADGGVQIRPWPGGIIKLPYPVTAGWVLDFGFSQYIGTVNQILGPFLGPDVQLTATIANSPTSGRNADSSSVPARRFYPNQLIGGDTSNLYLPDKMRWVRYYPTDGLSMTSTYIGIGQTLRSLAGYTIPEFMEANYPPGVGFIIVGHAINTAGMPQIFGDAVNTGEEDWMFK